MLKIIADENILFAKEYFSDFGEVHTCFGREINNSILKNADILLTRSITKVDKNLLNGTKIKFVGTATIGTDHIDISYLNKNKIFFADAKGCNSDAVAEYVWTALLNIVCKKKLKLQDLSIGIIGVGNIGSRIEKLAKVLGLQVKLNDPPLKRKTNDSKYLTLEETFDSDIITLHTPLNLKGIDKTYHLIDESKLKLINDGAIMINTSRGEVIDNKALSYLIEKKSVKYLTLILDVWENEPDIDINLLNKVNIGTCHIAGYSLEGKLNGTKILYNALSRYLNKNNSFSLNYPKLKNSIIEISSNQSVEELLNKIFFRIYDIKNDYEQLKEIAVKHKYDFGKFFDEQRKNYKLRREFSNWTIKLNPFNKKFAEILLQFRFKVI